MAIGTFSRTEAHLDDAWTRYADLNDQVHRAFLAASDAMGTDEFPSLLQRYYDALAMASRVRLEIRQTARNRTKVPDDASGGHQRRRDRAG